MTKHISETPATEWLKQNKVAYTEHPYDYVDHGGTAESSKQLGVPEHLVIKTLVMQDEQGKGLVVLMHGNCKTSTKNLARQIGCKTVEPCKPEVAQKNSGYLVGGTSPFGLRKQMPVYVESSILELTQIWINGGRRGFLVCIAPQVLVNQVGGKPVQCSLPQ
jgi:Cys-tRNA(Pro) deacylase